MTNQPTGKAFLLSTLGINVAGLIVGAVAFSTDAATLARAFAETESNLPFLLVTASTVLLLLGATTGLAWFGRLLQPWLQSSRDAGHTEYYGGALGSGLLLAAMAGSITLNGMVMSGAFDEQALAEQGSAAAASMSIESLIVELQQRDASTRIFAAHQLGEHGPGAASAIPALRETLQDAHAPVRVYAAEALWKVTGDASEAVPVLIVALEHEGFDLTHTHSLAVAVLTQMGPAAHAAIPALEHAAAEHPDELLRSEAQYALGRIRGAVPRNPIGQ